MSTVDVCAALRTWADLMERRKIERGDEEDAAAFQRMRRDLDLLISKSCLLDRMVHCSEQPSRTPCPVHKGIWSGIHLGWPGTTWSDGRPVDESSFLREWYDAGCRCFKHRCGCTTGWQPDEHCGCTIAPLASE